MKTVLSKALRGGISGAILFAAVYLVFFCIELFGFIKELLGHSEISREDLAGVSNNAGSSFTIGDYTPILSVWNPVTMIAVLGIAFGVGAFIGLIVGLITRAEAAKKVQDYNDSLLEDGTNRQKILFANNIRTMSESLTQSCTENLYYMNNLIETQYTSEAVGEEIMTELVKFIEYEQILNDSVKAQSKEGGN